MAANIRGTRPLEASGEADLPSLVLRERGDVVEILAGNVVLLSSAALETELAFGRLVARLDDDGRSPAPPEPSPRRVLVGGLGFGATLRGVLDSVPASAQVVVVERFAAVERLVRGPLAHIAQNGLDDGRVRLTHGDVWDALEANEKRHGAGFDAVLLDVDNGPEWATMRENARLYTPAGLARGFAALRPGGFLAVWSGYPADWFLARLRQAAFTPSLVPLREKGRIRARAYIGEKPDHA
jgi:spermidine synthase